MKKQVKYIVIFLIIGSLLYVLNYFKEANSASIIDYETEQPFYTSIEKEVVATGKLNPEDEIELKPQVSGIIDKIFVEEGDIVKQGDIIGTLGSSGRSTGPHLDIRLNWFGVKLDPSSVLDIRL